MLDIMKRAFGGGEALSLSRRDALAPRERKGGKAARFPGGRDALRGQGKLARVV